jgi:GTP cyclohydrolase I
MKDSTQILTPPAQSQESIADLVRKIIVQLGEDPERDGLQKTPERFEKALRFLTSGYTEDAEKLLNGAVFDVCYDEMVVVKDIEVHSLCEHHMLPFFGKCHVAYIPSDKVVGLSKIARLVNMFARRLQIQERLTSDIANAIQEHLRPQGVGVIIEARHLCMVMRGVEKQNSIASTSAMLGVFRDNKQTRDEFLSLVRIPRTSRCGTATRLAVAAPALRHSPLKHASTTRHLTKTSWISGSRLLLRAWWNSGCGGRTASLLCHNAVPNACAPRPSALKSPTVPGQTRQGPLPIPDRKASYIKEGVRVRRHHVVIGLLCAISIGLLSVAAGMPRVQTLRLASSSWDALADDYFDQVEFKLQPTAGTSAGFHQYDVQLEDYSRRGVDTEIAAKHAFEKRVESFDPKSLDPTRAADRELLLSSIRGDLLTLETIQALGEKSRHLLLRHHQ